MDKQNDIVTNKDINKAAFRYMFMACNTFNYETQQGPAVVFGLNKLLRKIYSNDDEYVAALNTLIRQLGWLMFYLERVWQWKKEMALLLKKLFRALKQE